MRQQVMVVIVIVAPHLGLALPVYPAQITHLLVDPEQQPMLMVVNVIVAHHIGLVVLVLQHVLAILILLETHVLIVRHIQLLLVALQQEVLPLVLVFTS